ncbi:biorientation of chromosomes in cell division protein 1-like [Macadamia integrifolia]|uniref:biorientation of chromosomes in cell division protein 1-like n=1 Tax=Macadamia integrifolia TaxID=60698 RepID=UPI001C4FCFB0|nr:biorientation of chromosomes in cell division protein 1-like [Macadamia integrifolia]
MTLDISEVSLDEAEEEKPMEVEGQLGDDAGVVGRGAEGDGGDANGAVGGGGAGRGASGASGGVSKGAGGVGGDAGGVPPLDPQTMGSTVASSRSTRDVRPYGHNDVMAHLDTTTNLLRRMDNRLESMDSNYYLIDNRVASLEA